ncbi:unnamed protein product [Rotaria sordida]|uniref:AMP-dependent synthetase/ligase domain-containing protein n=1 Tax=Rotaria sordida TaxID=392033 RepID=A0A819ERK0_9BILA|nr:unnamed protein product [Rotaria sordida]
MLQPIGINQEGELCLGGVGVFAGYLGRDDLTAKSLIEIDGQSFYRTGDLVRMDNSGLIYYLGRKDHQVKLRGQRIELAEIEKCLLNTSISACVVTKWGNDHLVAYVQGRDIDEKELNNYCCARLPPFMIPSKFIILERFPLNANGKIDRKSLPSPDFSIMSTMTDNNRAWIEPISDTEKRIYDLWREMLHVEKLSTSDRCRLWNLYGPAETTMDSTCYLVDVSKSTDDKVPIGRPLPNYQCMLLDEMLQPMVINQEGELYIGGVGVFAGYLGRDDLTAKSLVEIDDQSFYRTGDLVRMDSSGLIYYLGRKDHQAFELLPRYEELSVAVLRWLGAHVDNDVKIAHIIPILRYPSNLLRIERGVTTFGYVMLAPFEMTNEGDCSLDYISLGSGTNLANGCTLMPGTQLSCNTMIVCQDFSHHDKGINIKTSQ